MATKKTQTSSQDTKRKREENDGSDTPAKRTRSSGIAPLYIPIDGAPPPPGIQPRPEGGNSRLSMQIRERKATEVSNSATTRKRERDSVTPPLSLAQTRDAPSTPVAPRVAALPASATHSGGRRLFLDSVEIVSPRRFATSTSVAKVGPPRSFARIHGSFTSPAVSNNRPKLSRHTPEDSHEPLLKPSPSKSQTRSTNPDKELNFASRALHAVPTSPLKSSPTKNSVRKHNTEVSSSHHADGEVLGPSNSHLPKRENAGLLTRSTNLATHSASAPSSPASSSDEDTHITPRHNRHKLPRISGSFLPLKSSLKGKGRAVEYDGEDEVEVPQAKSPKKVSIMTSQRHRSSSPEGATSDFDDPFGAATVSTSRAAKSRDRPISPPNFDADAIEDVSSLPPSAKSSPSKQTPRGKIPSKLPPGLEPYLETQKRACLAAFHNPPLFSTFIKDKPEEAGNVEDPIDSLTSLLRGTVERGEGNSCLVLGPRGSGKNRAIEEALVRLNAATQSSVEGDSASSRSSSVPPIIIRLSGHAQNNDKLAMKEIGRQLLLQTGSQQLSLADDDDEADNDPLLPTDHDDDGQQDAQNMQLNSMLPPPTYLPTLITTMSSLPRPTIVILDAFDLFMNHARQALLYCLLDTVQSCRAGEGRNGVAVVGLTSRVDSLNLLEKRVKSRFSHRIIQCSPPSRVEDYILIAKKMLKAPLSSNLDSSQSPDDAESETALGKWNTLWEQSVETLFSARQTQRVMKETFELARDVTLLCRLLFPVILGLDPSTPWITPAMLSASTRNQRAPDRFPFLVDLSQPCLTLLVAAHHIQTSGHEAFTFEHIFDTFSRAARLSSNSNVSLDGVGIGLPKFSREIMFAAFEELIETRIFQLSGVASNNTARQFVKYRCEVFREDIRAAVEKRNNTQLKRWFTRPS